MERSQEEQKRYDEMQTQWSFHILKDARVAKWIIYACLTNTIAAQMLQLLFKMVDNHPENTSEGKVQLCEQEIPQALKTFRESALFTLEFVKRNEACAEAILIFYRVKLIREQFAQPGQPVSSTDTDQSIRAKSAAQQLQDDDVVRSFSGLSDALQVSIADFHSTRIPDDPGASRAALNVHMGLDGSDDAGGDSLTIYPAPSSEQSHGEESPHRREKRSRETNEENSLNKQARSG